jgi:hypothetical protein
MKSMIKAALICYPNSHAYPFGFSDKLALN